MITGKDVKKIIHILNEYKKEGRSIEIVIGNDIGCVNLFFYNGNYEMNYYPYLNGLIISQLEEEQDKRADLVDIDFSNIVDYSLIENITDNNSKNFILKLIGKSGKMSAEITSVIGV